MKKKPYKLEVIQFGRIVKTYESLYVKPLIKAFKRDWILLYEKNICGFILYDREGKELELKKQMKIIIEKN